MTTSKLWHYRAQPIRAVDGDTVELLIDHGFRHFSRQHIRLQGIDALEMNSPDPAQRELARLAKEACDRWLAVQSIAGDWPLIVTTGKLSFDRWVGVVVNINGTDIVDFLVTHGHAKRVGKKEGTA